MNQKNDALQSLYFIEATTSHGTQNTTAIKKNSFMKFEFTRNWNRAKKFEQILTLK